MRRFPHSWDTLRTKLGFRKTKVRRRSDRRHRLSRVEPLEIRALLSGDPISTLDDEVVAAVDGPVITSVTYQSKPTYVLTNVTPRSEQDIEEAERLDDLDLDEEETPAELFLVTTEYTDEGPKAVVSLNPVIADRPPGGLQTLKLELQLDGQTLETYEILVDIAEERFRTKFLNDRIDAIREKAPQLSPEEQLAHLSRINYEDPMVAKGRTLVGFVGPLTSQQEVARSKYDESMEAEEAPIDLAEKSTDDLLALAADVTREVESLRPDVDLKSERVALYAEVGSRIRHAKALRLEATSESAKQALVEKEKSLQEFGLLMAKDLVLDLTSGDAEVKAAAEGLRDELIAIGDVYHTAFTGLGIDREMQRTVTSQGDLKAYALIESGHYAFDSHVAVDLAGQPAMVQVTRLNPSSYAPLITVEESPAVKDGYIGSDIPTTPYANEVILAAIGSGAGTGTYESLIKFDLGIDQLENAFVAGEADFRFAGVAGGSGDIQVLGWKSILPGGTGSPSDWDETNLTWDRVYTTLDIDAKLSEFQELGTWEVNATTSLAMMELVQRALLYGDANGDGNFDATGMAGDVEAFHLAVVDWDAYVAEYGPRASSLDDLVARNDGGLGDGVIDSADVADFLRRYGISPADFDMDGTVDGNDWSIYQSSYDTSNIPLENARFGQGDANFDGVVNAADFAIIDAEDGVTGLAPVTPEVMLWLRPATTATSAIFASQEHFTYDGPTLDITESPDLVLNDFTVSGTNLRVDYSVLGTTFSGVQVQLFKEGSTTPLYTSSTQSGALGARSLTVASSALSSIVEGDVVYAKIIGTPTSGTQSNTSNDRLDFEFSTDSHQVVNSLDDAGMDTLIRTKHTLRELIEANNVLGWFDTITFDPELFEDGAQRIVLGDHDANGVANSIGITKDIEIQGPGAHLLAISGNEQTIVFSAGHARTIAIADMSIENGTSQWGGGAISSVAHLTLDGVTLRRNHGTWQGGAVRARGGDLTILNSTLVGNTSEYGGALYFGPEPGNYPEADGVYSVRIEDSTFYDNEAVAYANVHGGVGGGAYLNGTSAMEVEILNSTFSGNGATKGGAIALYNAADYDIINTTITENDTYINGLSAYNLIGGGGLHLSNTSNVTFHNSIIAGNTSTATWRTNFSLSSASINPESSHNLTEKSVAPAASVPFGHGVNGNIVVDNGAYLGLAPLDYYGGPTRTHLVLPNSPAVDAGSDEIAEDYDLLLDQRGFTRFYDLVGVNDAGGNLTDIGAYEDPDIIVNDFTDFDSEGMSLEGGQMTLRAALNDASTNATAGFPKTIRFDESKFADGPKTILLEDVPSADPLTEPLPDQYTIDFEVTIIGPGADLLTIDGNHGTRIFSIEGAGGVHIEGLTIANGRAVDYLFVGGQYHESGLDDAGAIRSSGILTLDGVRIIDSEGHRGGALRGGFQTTILNSEFLRNEGDSGGAIYQQEGTLTIRSSTIAENYARQYGGIYSSFAQLEITNSTIAKNQGTGSVSAGTTGGIHIDAIAGIHDAVLTNVTVVDNVSNLNYPGGIYSGEGVTLVNSIVANNLSYGGSSEDVAGWFDQDSHHNIVEVIAGSDLAGTPYLNSSDPELGPFGYYGGLTQTYPLLPTSPAIDAGDATSLAYDQRGEQFDRNVNGVPDIGAVESHVTINQTTGDVDIWGTEGNDVINLQPDGVLIDTAGGILLPLVFTSLADGVTITVHALGGDDVVSPSADFPRGIIVHGGEGNDQFHGTSHNDELYGDAGADVIFAGAGDDEVYGGDGGDSLHGGAGTDAAYGQGGYDFIDSGEAGNLGPDQAPVGVAGSPTTVLSYIGTPTWQWSATSASKPLIPKGGNIDIAFDVAYPPAFQLMDPANGWLKLQLTDDLGNEITAGVTIAAGLISITPPENLTGGTVTHNYRLQVIDESQPLQPELFAEASFAIDQESDTTPSNHAPTLTGPSSVTVAVRPVFDLIQAFRLVAVDTEDSYEDLDFEIISVTEGGQVVSQWQNAVTLAGAPSHIDDGILLVSANQLMGSDNQSTSRSFVATVKVTDTGGLSDTKTITIVVDNDNLQPPVNLFGIGGSTSLEEVVLNVGSPSVDDVASGDVELPEPIYWNIPTGDTSAITFCSPVSPPDPIDPELYEIDTQTQNQSITFEFLDTPPPGVTLSPHGWIKWEPPAGIGGNAWRVRLKVTDDGTADGQARTEIRSIVFTAGELDRIGDTSSFTEARGLAAKDYYQAFLPGVLIEDNLGVAHTYITSDLGVTVTEQYLVVEGPQHAMTFALGNAGATYQYQSGAQEEGLDTFTYKKTLQEHSVSSFFITTCGGRSGQIVMSEARVSNDAVATLEVGQSVRPDIDVAGPSINIERMDTELWHTIQPDDEDEDGAGGLKVFDVSYNNDDDNDNGVSDYSELLSSVSGEDDLVELNLGYWIRQDVDTDRTHAYFTTSGNSAFRLWDSPTKEQEIFIDGTVYAIDELPESIYVEAARHYGDARDLMELSFNIAVEPYADYTKGPYGPEGGQKDRPSPNDSAVTHHGTFTDTIRLRSVYQGPVIKVVYDPFAPDCECECTCSTSPKAKAEPDSGSVSVSAPLSPGIWAKFANIDKNQPLFTLSFDKDDYDDAENQQFEVFLLDYTDPFQPTVEPFVTTGPVNFPYASPVDETVYSTAVGIGHFGPDSGYHQYYVRPYDSGASTPAEGDFHAKHWLPILKHGDYGFGDGWNIAGVERIIARPDDPTASDIYWIRADNEILQYPVESFVFDEGESFVLGHAEHDRNATILTEAPGGGFILTDKFENETHFDASGWITKRVDAYGNETVYYYHAGYRIDRVETTIDGHETTFHWDAGFNRVEKVEDFAGRVTLLRYDSPTYPNQLTRIELPDPTGVIGEGGGPVNTFTYGSSGRIASFMDADNITTAYTYGHDGQVLETTNAQGTPQETSTQLVISKTGSYLNSFVGQAFGSGQIQDSFTGPNRTGSYIDELGRFTTFETNSDGYVVKTTDPTGAVTEYDRNSVGQPLEVRTYDAEGNLVDQVAYEYDTNFNSTAIIYYDVSGTAPVAIASEHFAFDAYSRPTSYVDELGRQVLIAYDDIHPGIGAKPGAAYQVTTRVVVGANDLESSEHNDLVSHSFYTTEGLVDHTVTERIDSDGTPVASIDIYYAYNAHKWVNTVATVVGGTVLSYSRVDQYDDFGSPEVIEELAEIVGSVDVVLSAGTLSVVGSDDNMRTTIYEYDRLDRLTQVALPDPGNDQEQPIVRYEYTATGRIEKEIQSFDGAMSGEEITTRYVYDERHRLKHQIYNYNASTIGVSPETVDVLGSDSADPNENVAISYQYDAGGNLTAVADPLGRMVTYAYDLLNRAIRITEPDPDGEGELLAPVSYLAYDAVGRLLAERDANGNVTRYAYDARHRVTDVYAPLGAHTQFAYDAAGQLRSVADAEGSTTKYTYDDAGRLMELRLPGQDTTPIRYEYDTLSNVRTVTDQLGRKQVYEYDELSRLERTIANYVDGVTSSAADEDIITTYTYLDDGMVDTVIETIGWNSTTNQAVTRQTSYEYDGAGRVAKVFLPSVNSDNPQVRRFYDPFGNVQYEVDQLLNVTEYQYDSLHRLTKVIQEAPEGPTRWNNGDIRGPGDLGFDIEDHPVTSYRYDAASQVRDVTDPEGRVSSHQYDNLGRVTLAISPDPDDGSGSYDNNLVFTEPDATTPFTAYTYDGVGSVKEVRNAGDEGTDYFYDALHRLVRETVTDATGGSTHYVYDRTGKLLSLTDPVGNQTSWAYDELDRVTSETNELGYSRTYAYDLASRMVEKIDRNGRKTEYGYDNMDRLTSEEWFATASTPTPSNTIDFSYDHAGRLLSSDDAFHEYAYEYDTRNNLRARQFHIEGLSDDVVIWKGYDSADRLVGVLAGFGELGSISTYDFVNNYAYDNLHRVTTVTQQGIGGHDVATKSVQLDYNAAGQLTAVSRYADLFQSLDVATTSYTYDDGGRLDGIRHHQGNSVDGQGVPNGTLLAGYGYTYDNQNRLDALNFLPSAYNSEDVDYNYDDRGQLTGAEYGNPANEEIYTYDENGNREVANGQGYYTGPDNRLTQVTGSGVTFAYDKEGNRVLKTDQGAEAVWTSYSWDHRNRLTKVSETDIEGRLIKTVEYSYDANNQWTSRTVDHRLESNLAADWAFDETSGTAFDSVDAGPATLNSGAAYTASGQVGGAVVFDGTNDYVRTDYELDNNTDFAISLWAKLGTQTSSSSSDLRPLVVAYDDNGLVGLEGATTNAVAISAFRSGHANSGELHVQVGDAEGVTTGLGLNPNEWHHIVLTVWSDRADLYVNGELVLMFDPGEREHGTLAIDLGGAPRNDASGTRYFAGGIDEFQVRTTVLSPSQIEAQYELGQAGTADTLEKTVFIHDGGQIVLELEDTVSSPTDELTKEDLTHRYLWGPAVDMLLADERVDDLFDADENEVLWALTDHLGTVRDLVDNNGQVRMHRAFDAFGNITGESHYDANGFEVDPEDPGYVTTDFGYTGKMLDTETDLQNNWNRWYDATVGRWISEDPIKDGVNWSAYVGNKATTYVDPDGLKKDGHHLIPWSLFSKEASNEVIEFFDSDETRIFNEYYKFHDGVTINGVGHPAYTKAVKCELDDFLGGKAVSSMTPEDARAFFKRIKKSTNGTIVNFNKGVQAEAYAALVVGEDAFKKAKAKRYSDSDALKFARDEAERKVKSTRAVISGRVVKSKGWLAKLAKSLPVIGGGVAALSCDDVNAGGREVFLELTGMDIPRDGGLLLVAGLEEAVRQGDEFKERVRKSEKWGWIHRGDSR